MSGSRGKGGVGGGDVVGQSLRIGNPVGTSTQCESMAWAVEDSMKVLVVGDRRWLHVGTGIDLIPDSERVVGLQASSVPKKAWELGHAAGVEPWQMADESGESWVARLQGAVIMGVGGLGSSPLCYAERGGKSGVVAFFSCFRGREHLGLAWIGIDWHARCGPGGCECETTKSVVMASNDDTNFEAPAAAPGTRRRLSAGTLSTAAGVSVRVNILLQMMPTLETLHACICVHN